MDKLPQRSISRVIMVSSENSFLWTGNRINENNISLTKRKRGNPWLVFHGGNATTAYNLLACDFLFEDFYILAVDIIGHPGKSAENSLPPALVMGAEKDCLFPGAGVIGREEKIIPNCTTYLLRGRGHMHFLTDEEKKMIVDFLLE